MFMSMCSKYAELADYPFTPMLKKYTISQLLKRNVEVVRIGSIIHPSSELSMKSQVLHTV